MRTKPCSRLYWLNLSMVSLLARIPYLNGSPQRLHLLLHLLAQVDQGEPRHVAQYVVVSDFLRLLEGGVDFSGKIGIFPVESFAHDDQMHGRVNTGFLERHC